MANYAILCHADGTNGSTTYTNIGTGGTLARTGSAALATAQFKFGTASSNHTVNGSVLSASSVTLAGDFTVSFQILRVSGFGGKPFCIGSEGTLGGLILEFFVNQVNLQVTTSGGGNTNVIALTGTNLGDNGSGWHHVVITRVGTTLRLVVDGVSQGTVTNSTSFSGRVMFGDKATSPGTPEGGNIGGYLDELLVISDEALYTTFPFTPPTAEYTIPSSGVTGTVAWTEANDTAAIAGSSTVSGTSSWTEANDTAAVVGSVRASGTAAWTEANDTATIAGSVRASGTVAWTEASDTASLAGSLTVSGTATWTEANDTAALSGTVGSGVSGSLAWTEADDSASLAGALSVSGSASWTEVSDTAAISGTVGTAATGSIAWTEANDTAALSGSLLVSGAASWTEANDQAAIAGSLTASGSAAWTEANDSWSITGFLGSLSGTLAWTEDADTWALAGTSGSGIDPFGAKVIGPKKKKKAPVEDGVAGPTMRDFIEGVMSTRTPAVEEDDEEELLMLLL